jgi:hypothetical protein
MSAQHTSVLHMIGIHKSPQVLPARCPSTIFPGQSMPGCTIPPHYNRSRFLI